MPIKESLRKLYDSQPHERPNKDLREEYEQRVKQSIKSIEGLPVPPAIVAGQYLYGRSENAYGARCLVLLSTAQIKSKGEEFRLKIPEELQHLSQGSAELIHSKVGLDVWQKASDNFVEAYNNHEL